MDDRNKSVRDRITASYQIEPLTEIEVFSYIKHRLRVAGTANLIFSQDAVREIYSQTRGYPRVINILCDRALVNGFLKERQRIDADIIKESAHDLRITIAEDKPKKKKTPAPAPDEPVAVPFESTRELTFTLKRFAYIGLFMILGLLAYFFSDSLFENFKHLKNFPIATRITGWFHGTEPGNALGPNTSERKPMIAAADELQKIGVGRPAKTVDQTGKAAGSSIASTGRKASFVVYFDYSSDEIPPQSLEVLNRITGIFFNSPVKAITLKGYTDFYGNENYEKYMSVERALQVKNFFVSQGIPASSLSVYGMGSENPGGINTTAEERLKSRRVEIEVSLSQDQNQ